MAAMSALGCCALPSLSSSAPSRKPACVKPGLRSYSLPSGTASLRSSRRIFAELNARTKLDVADHQLELNVLDVVQAEDKRSQDSSGFLEKAFLSAAVSLGPFLDVESASATNGEFGLLEGRSFALIHPIVMGTLFAYTLYAGYLGWQWRRVRTVQNEINELKKQVPKVAVAAGGDKSVVRPPSPVELQIGSLTEERKELVKGGFRDRHYNAGAILLGLGVFESVGGCLNTWFRTGKLFPGPHLFAGAGITICWAVAASLVPAMQKGNETARNLHIALNLINVFLFVWQIPTGLEIVGKVFEFTNWP